MLKLTFWLLELYHLSAMQLNENKKAPNIIHTFKIVSYAFIQMAQNAIKQILLQPLTENDLSGSLGTKICKQQLKLSLKI